MSILKPKIVFDINEEWNVSRLSDIGIKVKEKNKNYEYDQVLTNSASQGVVLQSDYFEKSIANTNNINGYYVVRVNDFVYNPRISNDAPVGPISRNTLTDGVMSPLYTVFRVKNINLEFLDQYFKSNYWHRYMKSVANYGARHDRMAISSNDFINLPIKHPSLTEQQKIADFLTAVDKRIELLEKKKTLLETYKKGVIKKIFNQEIRFKDNNGHDFPDWELFKLNDVLFEHKQKNNESKFEEVFSVSKQKGVVNQIEHLGRSYSAETIDHYKLINNWDIVYTKSPTSDFPFGIIKQNTTGRTGVLSPLYGVFRPKNKWIGKMIASYFESWVNTYNYLIPLVQKGAKNTMNINNNTFLNGKHMKLPTSECEQEKISNFLFSIEDQLELLETQIDKSKTWKKGLLQKMFV